MKAVSGNTEEREMRLSDKKVVLDLISASRIPIQKYYIDEPELWGRITDSLQEIEEHVNKRLGKGGFGSGRLGHINYAAELYRAYGEEERVDPIMREELTPLYLLEEIARAE